MNKVIVGVPVPSRTYFESECFESSKVTQVITLFASSFENHRFEFSIIAFFSQCKDTVILMPPYVEHALVEHVTLYLDHVLVLKILVVNLLIPTLPQS